MKENRVELQNFNKRILKLSFKKTESCTTYGTAYVTGCVVVRYEVFLRQKVTQLATQGATQPIQLVTF